MVPVLYSFRRCPYAIRARLALQVSGVSYELREIQLRDKPPALLAASPKGSVPVLVLPGGRVVDESWDIMCWALQQHDPDHWLGDDGGYLTEAAVVLEANDGRFKAALDRYKYADRYPEQPATFYRAEGECFLQQLEGLLLAHRYLLGDQLSIADMAVLPFIRQFAGVESLWFRESPYPRLRDWSERLLSSPLFEAVMQKYPVWQSGNGAVVISGGVAR